MGTEIYNCGVYSITAPSGNQYIGSSKNVYIRWRDHRRELSRGTHKNKALQNAWNKYSGELKFELLLVCRPEDLIMYEQQYLDFYKPEYNIATVAGNTLGIKLSDEAKKKISLACKGRPHSEEQKRKMSQALKGNTRWLGKKHKPETIEKMRQRALGKRPSERKVA
jgi:group I intron endonuclease